MAFTDAELEQQLKDVGKLLPHPPNYVQLLAVLDELENILSNVNQTPEKSMIDALKLPGHALIHNSLLKHSDIDIRVAVACCISQLTRITAPDLPYTCGQMRTAFQLIVSSFEDLADHSSRSYNKRASILETVSRVRSYVLMLDIECEDLVVKMFEHFLKSVRDYHLGAIFPLMENIMVSVIEESYEISVELLKPLLASVKKDCEGVLPVARKLGKGVLLKSAKKLKHYIIPALTSLGESLDMFHKVVAAVCEGTTANFDDNDDNDSELQLANGSKLEKGSPKSVMRDGVTVTVKERTSVDQASKKLDEDKSQELIKKAESPVTSAKRKRSTGGDEVSDAIKYDESLVGKKVKIWWPEDKMYYEGVVSEFYPANKKHKVSFSADGDEETLNLRTQRWEFLDEFSVQDYTEQNTSKEAAKSKKDEVTLKTSEKAVNESKGKSPPSCSKSDTNGEKMEYEKEKLRLEGKRLRLEAEKLSIEAEKERSKIRQEDERLRLEDERLKLEAEKMKLSKKESDERIMMMDVSVMTEMQRLYFEKLQKEILMRCDQS